MTVAADVRRPRLALGFDAEDRRALAAMAGLSLLPGHLLHGVFFQAA